MLPAQARSNRRTRILAGVVLASTLAMPLATACGARSDLDAPMPIEESPEASDDRTTHTADAGAHADSPFGGDVATDSAFSDAADTGVDATTDAGFDVANDVGLDARDAFVDDAPARADASDADASEGDASDADASDAPVVDAAPICTAWGGLPFPPTSYAMGTPNNSHTTPLAIGDFNHDGHPDISAVASSLSAMSVYLNHGDGTFGAPATFADGAWAEDVVAADFDGDEVDDIGVINGDSCGCCCDGDVAILRSLGDGTFAAAKTFASGGTFPEAGRAGDMNDDGRPDVVVVNLSGSIAVLLNDGAGGLRAPLLTMLGDAVELARTLALADLDGNGTLDVVISAESLYAASFQTFFNDGTGVLTPGTATTFGSPLASGYGYPSALALADLGGHGRNDLLIADRPDQQLLLYTNDGSGGFAMAPALLPAGGAVSAIAVADFNVDGVLDVAVSGGTPATAAAWVQLALGTGGGDLGPWNTDLQPSPGTLAPGDFNRDGFPDLASGGESWVNVYLSQCQLPGDDD